jgi:hypothetical protein
MSISTELISDFLSGLAQQVRPDVVTIASGSALAC